MNFEFSDELMAELSAAFAIEGAEQLDALNSSLLQLEAVDDLEDRTRLIDEMLRNAHTIKGGAAAVGLSDVRDAAHELETIFSAIQRQGLELDKHDYNLIFETVDAISGLVRPESNGDVAPTGSSLPDLTRRLSSLTEGTIAVADDHPRTPPIVSVEGTQSDSTAATSSTYDTTSPDSGTNDETPGPATATSRPADEVVRIPLPKLDGLMNEIGELIVSTSGSDRDLKQLRKINDSLDRSIASLREGRRSLAHVSRIESLSELPSESAIKKHAALIEGVHAGMQQILSNARELEDSLRERNHRVQRISDGLHTGIREARMLPLSSITNGFARMVRDLAGQEEKIVELSVAGDDTVIDRAILEQVKAPLMHLLRNAIDHGIESPADRAEAGKKIQGSVSISASSQGEIVEIVVEDDGRGIDPEVVRRTAIAKGVVSESSARAMGEDEARTLIFRSGMTTSPIVTDISGRGVGLDVVREAVERLGGTISLHSIENEGTRFALSLPQSVSTTTCLLVHAGDQRFGIPLSNIHRVVRAHASEITEMEGRPVINFDDEPLPLTSLTVGLGLPERQTDSRKVLILRSGERTAAVAVDDLDGVHGLVVKPLPRGVNGVEGFSGGAVLEDGGIILVLQIREIMRSDDAYAVTVVAPKERASVADKTVLLADDSLTTRTLEKNILETAGFTVKVAVDGLDAWRTLKTEDIDLLVSDVQMPSMDGFELTEKVRSDRDLMDLPVVLVTSLGSPEDRARGVQAGADAYIVKSAFDQEQLLDVLRRLI